MPYHASAKKRSRQAITKTERNKSHKSHTKNLIKSLRSTIEEKDKTKAETLLSTVQSDLARLAKRGIIKKNNAARKISRLAQSVIKI